MLRVRREVGRLAGYDQLLKLSVPTYRQHPRALRQYATTPNSTETETVKPVAEEQPSSNDKDLTDRSDASIENPQQSTAPQREERGPSRTSRKRQRNEAWQRRQACEEERKQARKEKKEQPFGTGVWTSLREKLQEHRMSEGIEGALAGEGTSSRNGSSAQDPTDSATESVTHSNETDPAETSNKDDLTQAVVEATEKTKKKNKQDRLKKASNKNDSIQAAGEATEKVLKRSSSRKPKKPVDVKVIVPRKLLLNPLKEDMGAKVPKLAHNLDRVLFNPGVYDLQDQRSRVYNFDPHLASIMPVKEFDFDALKEYITSSKDTKLRDLSFKHGKKYCGSTSSMTSILSHFHYLLSAWRKPSFDHLSRSFKVEYESFTMLTRGPAAAFANYQDGTYAIDADKEFDSANILSMLGKSMEKFLTLPKEEFEKYRRTHSHQLSEEEKNAGEAFHYTTYGDFMMRSQLDAHDRRLPGTGMFDLKTRAVLSIRMDVEGFQKGLGYEIRDRFGTFESYEREYYDMIRSAFLKYSLQVRMGRMDGIFVAYHNTERIFGFQYISLEEMDRALHGTSDRSVGDEEFKASLTLFNDVLNRASERFPGKSLRLHVETRPTKPPLTYFFAEPVENKQIQETQELGKESVEKFQKTILGMKKKANASQQLKQDLVAQVEQEQLEDDGEGLELSEDPQRQAAWDNMMAALDETVENDALGLQTVRDAIEQALEQGGLLRGKEEAERNLYLNSLVDALEDELSESKEQAQEIEQELEAAALAEESTETDMSEKAEEAESAAITAEDRVDPLASSSLEAIGCARVEGAKSTEEADSTSELGAAEEAGSSDPSLKDLILKVTQTVDNRGNSLSPFEQVLSELVQQQLESMDNEEINAVDPGAASTDNVKASEENEPSQVNPMTKEREIMGMYITVRNTVKGEVVDRVEGPCNVGAGSPSNQKDSRKWVVEYTVTELPKERALTIYSQIKKRRRSTLMPDREHREELWHKIWRGGLKKSTDAGREFRKAMTKSEANARLKVAWKERPLMNKARNKSSSKKSKESGKSS